MTATSVEKVNGTPQTSPELGERRPKPDQEQSNSAPQPSRREEKRLDKRADRVEDREDRAREREEARRDREHKLQVKEQARQAKLERKQQQRADREKARAKRRKERRAAWLNLQTKLAHHMPLWGLPVVAVSLIMGWSGQAQAASHLGMGWAAPGVPVLTEGMTMTTAGLTGQAIEQGRPYKWLLRITWLNALFAAGVNGFGHLIEDASAAGMYRAAAYAVASLAGLALFAVVLRSRRAAISGKSAAEIARWKRLSRRHPLLMRRARRVADNTGVSLASAWATVWERANGAKLGEPSIREIRASQRAAHLRRQATSWDGRRGWRKQSGTLSQTVPAVNADAPEAPTSAASGDARTPVQAPFLPVALLVPGGSGEWVQHHVPVLPMTTPKRVRTHRDETATTRSPQGKDAVFARTQKGVSNSRLQAVRKLVEKAAADHRDLRKHPSNRSVMRALGCRREVATDLLATVLAERGITRD
ncbi:hypothetical protein M2155_000621 [Streptomyces sp. SAI-119]|uniref:hypothetical protein n=1 Tax=Streptomyces sp. SAI-119 TaxID=2940541 RepID=UPI00247314A3|nr:hypothetical protein [Streptomyces sp. SAI-119]MDH6448213.1 hypothetical protein [Streptomyces sp. SAI-119]